MNYGNYANNIFITFDPGVNVIFRKKHYLGHYDTQHNDIQHKDTQHNDIQHEDTQHNDIHNIK
jgi:hypothetical protein